MRAYIEEKATPCLFCGSTHNIVWHHVNPNEKNKNVYSVWSWKSINEEMDKCWCLCEPCHHKLHLRLVDPLPECYEKIMISHYLQ